MDIHGVAVARVHHRRLHWVCISDSRGLAARSRLQARAHSAVLAPGRDGVPRASSLPEIFQCGIGLIYLWC